MCRLVGDCGVYCGCGSSSLRAAGTVLKRGISLIGDAVCSRPFELGPPLRQTAVRKLSPDALPSRHAGGQTTHERTTWGSTATLTERARDGRADGPSTNAPAVAGAAPCPSKHIPTSPRLRNRYGKHASATERKTSKGDHDG
ncbi:uncharacterized protein [Dermacentor andersoni]|uniref:uncharacterized protein isoform X1 n=1 Tax=Dermacentor andersoni TaxID=34620 RepID=UPI003B3A140F